MGRTPFGLGKWRRVRSRVDWSSMNDNVASERLEMRNDRKVDGLNVSDVARDSKINASRSARRLISVGLNIIPILQIIDVIFPLSRYRFQ